MWLSFTNNHKILDGDRVVEMLKGIVVLKTTNLILDNTCLAEGHIPDILKKAAEEKRLY